MKKRGKISPTRAAQLLDVHPNTVYSWCHRATNGEPSKLENVERHPLTGRYSIDYEEIMAKRGKR